MLLTLEVTSSFMIQDANKTVWSSEVKHEWHKPQVSNIFYCHFCVIMFVCITFKEEGARGWTDSTSFQ